MVHSPVKLLNPTFFSITEFPVGPYVYAKSPVYVSTRQVRVKSTFPFAISSKYELSLPKTNRKRIDKDGISFTISERSFSPQVVFNSYYSMPFGIPKAMPITEVVAYSIKRYGLKISEDRKELVIRYSPITDICQIEECSHNECSKDFIERYAQTEPMEDPIDDATSSIKAAIIGNIDVDALNAFVKDVWGKSDAFDSIGDQFNEIVDEIAEKLERNERAYVLVIYDAFTDMLDTVQVIVPLEYPSAIRSTFPLKWKAARLALQRLPKVYAELLVIDPYSVASFARVANVERELYKKWAMIADLSSGQEVDALSELPNELISLSPRLSYIARKARRDVVGTGAPQIVIGTEATLSAKKFTTIVEATTHGISGHHRYDEIRWCSKECIMLSMYVGVRLLPG